MDPKRVEELEAKYDQGTLTFDEFVAYVVQTEGETAEDAARLYVGYLAKHTPNYGNGIVF